MAEAGDPVRILERVLTEHGPLDEDGIAARLRDAGVTDVDAMLRQVQIETDCPTRQLVDERWVWLPAVLAGRIFTHRVGPDEAAHDLLGVTPDLAPITTLCEHERYQRLVDGSAVQVVLVDYDDELLEERGIDDELVGEGGALLLAPGTLAALGVGAGDLVGVRLTGPGLALERVTATTDPGVGAALAATLGADEPEFFDAAVWTACAADPALFIEPTPPLCEIAAQHGLAHRDHWLAPSGFDYQHWDFERGCASLAERHDLDDDDAFALYTMIEVCHQMSRRLLAEGQGELPPDAASTTEPDAAAADAATAEPADTQPDAEPKPDATAQPDAEPEAPPDAAGEGFFELIGELGAELADPVLAELLVAETLDVGYAGAGALGMFAEVLEPKVPPAARVACRWLRAVALERIGDVDGNERELLAAESMDVNWPLPLVDLARIASDRGDAEHGLALLHRAGAEPDHPLMRLLQRHLVEARGDVGRNEPCWCGSGRKYKRCHLGHERLPLAGRVDWLYAKAAQHMVASGYWTDLLAAVAYQRCRDEDDGEDEALAEALADPLVLDAVLFEGGAFGQFLALRGSLLPDDERTLAQQWLLADRSVFEVEQARPGQGATVRDLRSGDTHQVSERAGSRQLKVGQLICARLAPTGDGMVFFAPEPVAPQERDPLIELLDAEPDPVELVAQLSR